MILKVLGCGDAFGSGGRNNTSFLMSEGNDSVLMDCGATTLVRLKQEQIPLDSISTIVLSHFHGDHYGGIPFFLISSLFEEKRTVPITIVGPPKVEEKVLNLLEAMYPSTRDRLGALEIRFVEFVSGNWIKINELNLKALPMDHSPPSSPFGIKLEWRGKIFAFSGDTSWNENLVELSRDADLFVCEANFLCNQAFGHLSYKELTDRREDLKCDNIYLTHMNLDVIQLDTSIFPRLEDGMEVIF